MPFQVVAKNAMLAGEIGVITHASLYTDDAATVEITGGAPAYARKAITWGTPSNGSAPASNQPAFDIPAGTTVSAVGFMTAVSGGTQRAFYNVPNEIYNGQGTYTLTSAILSITDPA